MGQLQDFDSKDMIEQIILLDTIKESGLVEELPALLELLAHPLGDPAVDEMVYHTAFALMQSRTEEIGNCLRHASANVRLLAIRLAGECLPPACLPVLTEMLRAAIDAKEKVEILRTLAGFKDPSLLDILLPYAWQEDDTLAGLAMEALAASGDRRSRDALLAIAKADLEAINASGPCDFKTALALENLAGFRDQETIDFLVSHIHHPSPSLRRMVMATLAAMDNAALPTLESILGQGGQGEQIMAANIIGMSGQRKGADILVARLHKEGAIETNLRFAIYEALGRISSLISIVGLIDGLAEEDELALIAVVHALNDLCNPAVVKKVNELLSLGSEQGQRIMQAMVTARAVKLFRGVYETGAHANALIEAVRRTADLEALGIFRAELTLMAGEMAAADRLRLEEVHLGPVGKRVLAADDSKALLFFYKGVAAEMGLELITAVDGKEAFDLLRKSPDIDLLVTDMNMPNMDGIELTRAVRQQARWQALPILMATTESEKGQSAIATQAGVSGFISKPFTREKFKQKLAKMLG